MTTFTIAPANSVFGQGTFAFRRDSAAADSLIVRPGAFLIAAANATQGTGKDAVFLAKTGAWTVEVDGQIVSTEERGLLLAAGNAARSTITVGADGSIGGRSIGLEAASAAAIINRGVISSSGTAIGDSALVLRGAGAHNISNSGRIEGDPDMQHVSTSYAERSNLTMRMHNRRFTRLTNAFSLKFENHVHMVAIWTVWYNWVRIHKSLRITPAMAAGLTTRPWDWEEIIGLMDLEAPKPGRPKAYKKREAEISN